MPHSVGLIGWGSEVQGFDTSRSTEHAWGPRLQVFLHAADAAERGTDLDRRLDDVLPVSFGGYPVRFAFPDGAEPRHWVAVTDVEAYFADYLDELLAREQNRLGLAEPVDPTVRRSHSRPFLVLDAHRVATSLVHAIEDPVLRALAPIGAIDQYVDNTDLLDRTGARVRRSYVRGPARC